MKFSPDGQSIVSGGHDKRLMLWRVYGQEPENYMMLEGHSNAVTEVHWTKDGEKLISCSVDKTVRAWDAMTGEQVSEIDDLVQIRRILVVLLIMYMCTHYGSIWNYRLRRCVNTMRL